MKKIRYYITHWEVWHWFAKYIVIGPAWIWHCLRARSPWFFTPSNPTITFGGFIGESKREIYKQLPPSSYPESIYISHEIGFSEVENLLSSSKIMFPLAVKPDVGMMGFMFRRVDSPGHLRAYHTAMTVDYIIQELVNYPLEVSVFYYRYPGEEKGHITGFLKKEFMEVYGDGRHTLEQLIKSYPRALFRQQELLSKHESKLSNVIPEGEQYCLSYALNLSRGGRLVSLENEKDDALLAVFDKLSHYAKDFYYGRYDIKCASIEDLKKGENFSILEYNGCGAEPHHVYGNGYSFMEACRILMDHWSVLYTIASMNYKRGIKRWSISEGAAFTRKARKHFQQLSQLDKQFEFEKERKANPALIHSMRLSNLPPTIAQQKVA